MNNWICSLYLLLYKCTNFIGTSTNHALWYLSLAVLKGFIRKLSCMFKCILRTVFAWVELVTELFIRTRYKKVFCFLFFCRNWEVLQCAVIYFHVRFPKGL
jgi:hypothetical protein